MRKPRDLPRHRLGRGAGTTALDHLLAHADARRFVRREPRPAPAPPRAKPKLKKLRLGFILVGLSALALVSTLFGMLMAVASDLPSLENTAEFRAAKNSTL